MYVSGTPGTGKTATVRAVISALDQAVGNGELSDFTFIEINGMKVTDPAQAYCMLYEAVTDGERVSPKTALEGLEQILSKPSPGRTPM